MRALFKGWIAWQVLGTLWAAPALYAIASTSWYMAIWVSFCVAVGLALSIVVPLVIWRRMR